MNEDVQYESGTSPVQVRMCSTSKQGRSSGLAQGVLLKKFQMNESLLLLIYQVKMGSTLWEATKIN